MAQRRRGAARHLQVVVVGVGREARHHHPPGARVAAVAAAAVPAVAVAPPAGRGLPAAALPAGPVPEAAHVVRRVVLRRRGGGHRGVNGHRTERL